ncbi:hypothetical protein J1N35_009299 [Gossypium stocksii]|uniref:Uncharacterized protein n=1 Tax=Gossypium stocksii TaxID=47602 RepID=A0A9D3VY26_9ROSI|nr:hypothetical protein J1N35_009299 [Gossypium stocksii]
MYATPIGLVFLLFTLAGGVLYQQSVTGLKPAASVHALREMYLAAFGHHEIPLSPRIKPGYYNLYAEKPLNVVIYIVETRLTPLEKSANCCQLGAGRYLNGFGIFFSEGFVS